MRSARVAAGGTLLMMLIAVTTGCGSTTLGDVPESSVPPSTSAPPGSEAAIETTSTMAVDSSQASAPGELILGPGEAQGEVFLEPAGSHGPDPFTAEVLEDAVVSTTAPVVSTTDPSTTVTTLAGQVVVAGQEGDQPGLYGGTRDDARCDADAILAFLLANPPMAEAWVAAMNADPTLAWDDGRTDLRVADLPDYFAELTPVTLLQDTRVTNHGYREGRPTPRQSVLQAGTAVLVDRYGVPRARCACGNPLTPPVASPTPPTYAGDPWPGFGTTIIIVVQPSTVIIDVLVLVDINTGVIFVRPVGTAGTEDTDEPPFTGVGSEGVVATAVSGTVDAGGGFEIDAPYDETVFEVYLDPAQIDWIAFSSLSYLEDRGVGWDGSRVPDGILDIVFANVDDFLVVDVVKDGVRSGPIFLHDNDAYGTPIGNQAVVYGTHPSVWFVQSIDWSTDPPSSLTATGPETGELTSFIDREGAGTYRFEVTFVNKWTDRAAHGVLQFLVGSAIS